MPSVLSRKHFRERLLDLMARKQHWAWPQFVGPSINKAKLKIHYQQEYWAYVRDFPVFLAQVHSKNPPLSVRKMLAGNICEEETGHLSLGVSHPELFLKMMQGLGFRLGAFERMTLLPATQRYRRWLDRLSGHPDWVVGAAVMTIFVEGSVHDREEVSRTSRSKTPKQISAKIHHHPLARYHGVPSDALDLIRAHQMVEAGHRHDAYDMVVNHSRTRAHQNTIVATLQRTLDRWLRYRDGVARACGLTRP